MNQSQFFSVVNAIRSITDCTSKKIVAGNTTVQLDGMCSPFVSHRTVRYQFTGGELAAADGLLFEGNRRMFVGYLPSEPATRQAVIQSLDPEARCNLVQDQIAKGLVAPLLEMAKTYLGKDQYCNSLLVPIVSPQPCVMGWEEDGRPLLAEPGQATKQARSLLDELPLSVVPDEKGYYGELVDRREDFPSVPGGNISVQKFSCTEELAQMWVNLHLEARSVINSAGQILPPWEGYHIWGSLAALAGK